MVLKEVDWTSTSLLHSSATAYLFIYKKNKQTNNKTAPYIILHCLLRSEKQDKVLLSPVPYRYCCMDEFLMGLWGIIFTFFLINFLKEMFPSEVCLCTMCPGCSVGSRACVRRGQGCPVPVPTHPSQLQAPPQATEPLGAASAASRKLVITQICFDQQ